MILFIGDDGYQLFTVAELLRRKGMATCLISTSAPERKRNAYLRLPSVSRPLETVRLLGRLLGRLRKASSLVLTGDGRDGWPQDRGGKWLWNMILWWSRRKKRLFVDFQNRTELSEDAALESREVRTEYPASRPGNPEKINSNRIVDLADWPFLWLPEKGRDDATGILLVSSDEGRLDFTLNLLRQMSRSWQTNLFFRSCRPDERLKMRHLLCSCSILCDLDALGSPSETALQGMASGRCVITSAPDSYYSSAGGGYILADSAETVNGIDGTPLYGPVIDRPEDMEELFSLICRLSDSEFLQELMYETRLFAERHHDVTALGREICSRLGISPRGGREEW